MATTAADVAKSCFQAYVDKDRTAIDALIAPDFHFTSPRDNRLDRATYFERCWPNSQHIDGVDFINVVSDGPRVFVTYEGRANGKAFRNTEIMTISGTQIVDVEVYFGWSIPHEAPAGGYVDK
jgi:ketosteroid isomerase-like protein